MLSSMLPDIQRTAGLVQEISEQLQDTISFFKVGTSTAEGTVAKRANKPNRPMKKADPAKAPKLTHAGITGALLDMQQNDEGFENY